MSNNRDDSCSNALIEAARPFEEWYTRLQEHFTIHCTPSKDTSALVDGQINRSLPVHRWYNLKEAYSASLPIWACSWMKVKYNHKPTVLLDPFIGGGTTGVALAPSKVSVSGVEYNPFIHFVAQSKASATEVSVDDLEQAITSFTSTPLQLSCKPLPDLATLHNRTYSQEDNIRMLMAAYDRIDEMNLSLPVQRLLRLGIAAAVEWVFALRKDGRALRYVASLKARNEKIQNVLDRYWQTVLEDLRKIQEQWASKASDNIAKSLYSVYLGSAMNLSKLNSADGKLVALRDRTFDTILYSPPYLNNFDYSEIYKLELWLLRFVKSYSSWLDIRLGTVQSHHSVKFPLSNHLQSDPRMSDITNCIEAMAASECLSNTGGNRGNYMRPVVNGYFNHLYLALKEQWRVLKPGGILAYVVANSRHHYLPVATDVIIGEIARCIGFVPKDLVILRQRNGRTRQKLFLRESAVFMQKPDKDGLSI